MLVPMFVMIVFTMMVFIYGAIIRAKSIQNKTVPGSFYKIFDSSSPIPTAIIQHKNNIENLFQIPVIFYVACLTTMILENTTPGMIACGWLFVGFRICHSLVHLSYNKVGHRLPLFILGNISVMALWVMIMINQ